MRIYFSGIGGFAIGPLAMLALDMGHEVFGSDINISPISEELAKRGVNISSSQDGINFGRLHKEKPFDMFVYTAALPKNNPELVFARDHVIATAKRDGLINFLIKDKGLKTIAVSGTHGKTTTTAMLVWCFKKLHIKASHSVGSTMNFTASGKYRIGGEYFIYEADEYDKNFLNFNPKFSLVTSIDYDHPDTYPTKEDYQKAFSLFISQSQKTVMWEEDAETIGLRPSNRVDILKYQDYQHHLWPNLLGIELAGSHNRMNGTLVVEFISKHFGIDVDNVVEVINSFPGTARRFEKIAENLYSDYAHHPEEIKATLQMANEINQNVVVVYQPHQNLRQQSLLSMWGYGDSFNAAKNVYWLPTYLSREGGNVDLVEPSQLIATLERQVHVDEAKMNDKLQQDIQKHLDNGDMVVTMSAGDLDGWIRDRFGENK